MQSTCGARPLSEQGTEPAALLSHEELPLQCGNRALELRLSVPHTQIGRTS
jgi:hypothetical protein